MVLDSTMNHKKYVKEAPITEVVVESVEKPVEEISEIIDDKEVELFKLSKAEQIKELKDLGLTNKNIKKLKSEMERVNKIIELTN